MTTVTGATTAPSRLVDDRAAAILFASALAATLDSLGHMVWCEGVRDIVPCNYEPCVRVREAVATARRLGYLGVREEVEA